MTDNTDAPNKFEQLRRIAEARVRKQGEEYPPPADNMLELIHELQIHQTELEIQNVELQRTMLDLETLSEEYARLYEFAPVGYFNLDEKGRITKVNAAAVNFFQMSPHLLIGRTFSGLAHFEDISLIAKALKKKCGPQESEKGPVGFEARFSRKENMFVCARVEVTGSADNQGRFNGWRVAVIDITRQKTAETALQRAHDDLEKRVSSRTAELEEKNKTLERLADDLTKEQNQRKYLSKKLVEILEKERRNMAAALHDEIGHILTQIKMDLDLAKDKVDTPGVELRNDIRIIQDRIVRSMDYIHGLSRNLMPSLLDDLGLVPAVRSMCREINARHPFACQLYVRDFPDRIDDEKALVFYRIIQEASTNCLKHARASRMFINLTLKNETMILTIEDDGVGFDYSGLLDASDKKEKLGLMIMNERVAQIGGKFRIESRPGTGVQIFVEAPL